MIRLKVTSSNPVSLSVGDSGAASMSVEAVKVVEVAGPGGTSDHRELTGREEPDQHPMSAITGLEQALQEKQPVGAYLEKETDPTVPAWAKQEKKPSYTAQEVGALPVGTQIPSKTSDLTNDSGFLTGFTETDPTVPSWAKQATKPSYTPEEVGADPVGAAVNAVSEHNVSPDSHNDIRLLISGLTERLNALANSDDTTLDQMAEVVAYIKDNRELIEQVTTGKVSVTDIVDNLTTNVVDKPLSAAQGVALKSLIDTLTTAVGGKLEASALPEAINTALAQAKESGEFDGEPGKDGNPGQDGEDGASFWTSTAAPTSPNYTFLVSNLNGPARGSVKVGDIILWSYYRYTVTSVDGETVLTDSRTSLRGAAGATPDVYVIRWKNVWSTYPAADWEIKVYKNGKLCTEQLYAHMLFATSSTADPTSVAGASGNFIGTLTWSVKSAIRYVVEIYEDSTMSNLLASAFLTPAK